MSKRKSTSKTVPPIETELSVAYVKFGGNTCNGEYFFAFDKQHIHAPHRKDLPQGSKGVPMVFKLGKHVSDDFFITGLVSTDPSKNLSPGVIYRSIGEKTRELPVLNTLAKPGFFNIGILVTDTKRKKVVFCDPQVINTPGEGDNG
jgi:hypothetical protein